jgi:two-component system chemotaxis response regulator CheY
MKKTVLVVDDSMYMRTLIKDALIDAGYDVIGEAANGESAIDQAMALNPDLITLDNILPDMIGTDILRVIKGEEALKSKVIMISAVGQESVIQEGMEIGAEDYIVKPFTSEELIASAHKTFEIAIKSV